MTKGIGAVVDLITDIQEEIAKYTGHKYAIAGGCLRDAFFGKTIKDIDIVVYCSRQWTHLVTWPDTAEYGPTGEFMAADSAIKVRGRYPVQLIYRNGSVSASDMMEYHSLAISNFFYVDGALVIDPQAIQDYRDKKHTLNRTRWCKDDLAEQRLDTYVKKIQKKYPWGVRE